MTTEDLDAKLRAILKTFSKPDAPELQPEEDLRSRFDSLSILEMVFRFEDEFGIEIDTEKLHELKTYGDLKAAVEALLANKP